MGTNNGYFEHDPAVIAFAYSLVKEYDEHEREQDKIHRQLHPYVSPAPKKTSRPGGIVEAGARKKKNQKRGK